MKSFNNYIIENENPLSLGRLLKVISNETSFLCLVVRSETPDGAIMLVLSPEHPDVGNLVNSKNIENSKFKIINKNRIPITNYFFQNSNPRPVKKIEYHDEKIKEDIDEDIHRSALLYYQSKYRALKNKDATNEKLNLILEILFSDMNNSKLRFIA